MDPLTAGAVMWLLDQARSVVFDAAKNALLKGMGLIHSSSLTRGELQSLLDQYVQRLEREIKTVGAKLDQDRLALLKGALAQVKTAPRTNARDSFLAHALNTFHTIANLPQQGKTGTWHNAELRCVALLGIAAAHTELNDSPQLIAENLIAAVQADSATAEQWLGTRVVQVILRNYPSLGAQTTPLFPPAWGQLQPDSEQIFRAGLAINCTLAYDNQTHISTLTAKKPGITCAFLNYGVATFLPHHSPTGRTHLRDFAFRVEMTFPYSRAVRGGVLFRQRPVPTMWEIMFKGDPPLLEGYYFSVCTDGSYALDFIRWRGKERGEVKMIPLTQGDISVTAGIPLQIGVIAQGNDLTIEADTRPLAQVKDNLRSEGAIGIVVGDWEHTPPSEVQFRNFQLWTP
jgi:hypothetical protein